MVWCSQLLLRLSSINVEPSDSHRLPVSTVTRLDFSSNQASKIRLSSFLWTETFNAKPGQASGSACTHILAQAQTCFLPLHQPPLMVPVYNLLHPALPYQHYLRLVCPLAICDSIPIWDSVLTSPRPIGGPAAAFAASGLRAWMNAWLSTYVWPLGDAASLLGPSLHWQYLHVLFAILLLLHWSKTNLIFKGKDYTCIVPDILTVQDFRFSEHCCCCWWFHNAK
jgi:hypothetical protein